MILAFPLVLVGIYLLYRGFFIEPDALRLECVTVQTRSALPGDVRLLHITDMHLRNEPSYEERLLQLVRKANPDWIALTGDYVINADMLPVLTRVVRAMVDVCPVYASLGDNDFETPHLIPAQVQAAIERGGAHVLRNRGEYIRSKALDLFVAGIDDPRIPSADLPAALQNRDGNCVTVLLAHSAEVFRQAAEAGVDLLLAGHTHGGQVCLPVFGALFTNDRLGRKYASGMIRVAGTLNAGMQMHVGRGVGWAKLRVRLFCPPEITLIVLRR